ncbi:hypothetical protein D046_1948A, partial [Vibrio parahaemolyticus V-223/04]
MLYRHGE